MPAAVGFTAQKSPSAHAEGLYRLSKKPSAFSTACNNAAIFVPRSGTKILASLHARLAEQGLARHLIRFEAGFAPSSSPCNAEGLHTPGDLSTSRKVPLLTQRDFFMEVFTYFSSTLPPASSTCFFMASASSLDRASFRVWGTPSTAALASARPRPEISRTTLMTLIF